MRLTMRRRFALCFEILTTRSGHAHPSQEKQLSLFKRGYEAGLKDGLMLSPEVSEPPPRIHATRLLHLINAFRDQGLDPKKYLNI